MGVDLMGYFVIVMIVLIGWFCLRYLNSHECKYGEIKDGYQYCEICGEARMVGCNHKWVVLTQGTTTERRFDESEARTTGHWYHMRCSNCGEMKDEAF